MLKISDLTKKYKMKDKEITVFENLHLEIPFKQSASIVGKSGIGKSTLLHIMGTIDQPTKGKVFYENDDVFSLSDSQLAKFRNRNIGFIFQFHHLLSEFTALENVMIPNMVFEKNKTIAKEKAERLLEEVGLKDRITHKPSEMSGGEQQRVAIARALINQPKAIFADEPTGNLDEKTSEAIHELLLKLQKQYEATLVVVTHNERLAKQFDIKLHMTKGQILQLED
ncbi:ABC transporter ATP-binding protein [bacterium]|nr:ABC transporter ATP-binding protein [bacterium]